MSRYWSKFCYLKGGSVTLNKNFRGKGASLTNDFRHQKSRVPELLYGKKIAEKFNRLSKVHQRHRQTDDRQTTDGRLIAYSERNVVRSLKTKTVLTLPNLAHSGSLYLLGRNLKFQKQNFDLAKVFSQASRFCKYSPTYCSHMQQTAVWCCRLPNHSVARWCLCCSCLFKGDKSRNKVR